MNWPNKVLIDAPVTKNSFWDKRDLCVKWCMDNLSSKGVLWEYELINAHSMLAFYFAQSQDAILFRLINGV